MAEAHARAYDIRHEENQTRTIDATTTAASTGSSTRQGNTVVGAYALSSQSGEHSTHSQVEINQTRTTSLFQTAHSDSSTSQGGNEITGDHAGLRSAASAAIPR